jgi:hypothetical protein
MTPGAMTPFSTIRTLGTTLPADILALVSSGKELGGLTGDAYQLEYGVGPREAANRAWGVLSSAWRGFDAAVKALPDSDPKLGLTRSKWLMIVLRELGFGPLPAAPPGGLVADGRTFAISHQTHEGVPLHLLGVGVDLDRRNPGVPGAADRAPHALVQEYLNRSDNALWGVVSNGHTWRLLRDSSSLIGQSFVEFDLKSMFDGEVFSDFVAFFLLNHATRFALPAIDELNTKGDLHGSWLEQWRNHAITTGTRALAALSPGVQRSIEALGTGFAQHPANSELRTRLNDTAFTVSYHHALLRLVYRLLFTFVAEDRGVLLDPSADTVAAKRYTDWYSTLRLRRLSTKQRGHHQHGDLWQGLSLVLDGLGCEGGQPELALPGLGGIFELGEIDVVAGCELSNEKLLAAIHAITVVQPHGGGPKRTIDYRNLGAEELGSVYESLLELVPRYDAINRTFTLESLAGNDRKTTGSYYTPTSLIDCVLDSALDPLLDEAEQTDTPEASLLALTVCDPACGSGHFLVAAARRIAARVATVRAHGNEPSATDERDAMHDVVERCIFGVDLNPMAAELAKVSLWLESVREGKPLTFLDSHIKAGNALLGTTPALLAAGIPDEAYKPLEGDDKKIAGIQKKRNAQERGKGEQTGQDSMFATSGLSASNRHLTATIADIEQGTRNSLMDVHVAAQRLRTLAQSDAAVQARLVADAWCAAFVVPKNSNTPAIEHGTLREWRSSLPSDDDPSRKLVEQTSTRYRFFHWHLEFPQIFRVIDGHEAALSTVWTGGFSCVLGNPPFISPLTTNSGKVSPQRTLAKLARGNFGGPKADESSYFLLLAADIAAKRGSLGLVLPDSFLSSTDSSGIRGAIGHRLDMSMIWRGDGSEFEAAVTTIAVCLSPLGTKLAPKVLSGSRFEVTALEREVPWRAGSWSPLVADSEPGAEALLWRNGATLDELCSIGADYTDQYYGLRGAVFESRVADPPARPHPRLVTTGLVDPLRCLWGMTRTKFDKLPFDRPLVDLSRLSPEMQHWAEGRLVPKLLVATQGKLMEVVLDHEGIYLPCVPVISVVVRDNQDVSVEEVASILLSPASFEYFRLTKTGSGLSNDAIKASAADLRSMPAPLDLIPVRAASHLLDALSEPDGRAEFRRLMNQAYGLPQTIGVAWDLVMRRYMSRQSPPLTW